MAEWFEAWFGEEYLALYPHRDETEAERAVDLIRNVTGFSETGRVLDLACGAGRHQRSLARYWWTAGLDLSEVLLHEAHRRDPESPVVRGDMRSLPFRTGAFALVVNLFTSFGYFEADEQHQQVMREVARVTAPGGMFALDFLNAEHVREQIVPYDEREIGGRVVQQRRTVTEDGRFVRKEIIVQGEAKRFVERVRLFRASELAAMMAIAGFRVTHTFGNYDGGLFSSASPRVILFGQRA